MILDFHTHVFPPEVVENREPFLKNEPAFELIYGDPRARMVTAEGLIEAMDRDRVEQAVVFGFPWADAGLARTANACLLEAQERFPDRIHAFCTPASNGGRASLRDAQEALQRGMKGIGEVALYAEQMGADEWARLAPLAELARDEAVPLVLHVNESVGHRYPGKIDMRLRDVWQFAAEARDVTLVLAHWGGGLFFYELMKSVKRSVGSLYYDTAASPFLYDPSVYRIAVEILGTGKVLFGSDYPLIRPSRYFEEIEAAGLSEEARIRMLGGNALELLGSAEEKG